MFSKLDMGFSRILQVFLNTLACALLGLLGEHQSAAGLRKGSRGDYDTWRTFNVNSGFRTSLLRFSKKASRVCVSSWI